MGNSPELVALVLEQMEPLGAVTAKAMFGGHGLSLDGYTFALIADDTLYFKTDDRNRPSFEERNLEPFRPFADKPNYAMNYHQAPEEVLEDAEEMLPWARAAFEVALRAPKKARKKKKTPTP